MKTMHSMGRGSSVMEGKRSQRVNLAYREIGAFLQNYNIKTHCTKLSLQSLILTEEPCPYTYPLVLVPETLPGGTGSTERKMAEMRSVGTKGANNPLRAFLTSREEETAPLISAQWEKIVEDVQIDSL